MILCNPHNPARWSCRIVRYKMWCALNTDEVAEPNAFAVEAAVAAFTKGEPWIDALREYLAENKRLVSEFLKKELPKIKAVPSEATYLLWLDCHALSEGGSGSILISFPIFQEHCRRQDERHEFCRGSSEPYTVYAQNGGKDKHGNQHEHEGAGKGEDC